MMLPLTASRAANIPVTPQQQQNTNDSKVLKTLTTQTKQGNMDAQYKLGLLYYHGNGVAIDKKKALSLFTTAAQQDHPHAQYSLASIYATTNKDLQKALPWFKKAALQGIPQAQFNLGVFYQYGYIVEQDHSIAKKWYTLAENAGLSVAQRQLTELANTTMLKHPNAEYLLNDRQLNETRLALQDTPPEGNEWLKSQPAQAYTLQLSSFLTTEDTVKFIDKYKLQKDTIYVEVIIEGVTRYNVLYGSYATHKQAQKVATTLPKKLINNSKPWIRNFSAIQNLIKQ